MNYALIVAAGQGNRLNFLKNNVISTNYNNIMPKQFIMYKNRPLWWHSAKSFDASSLVSGIVIVFPKNCMDFSQEQVDKYKIDFSLPIILVAGGDTRQESVQNGLNALPKDCLIVAVHDAARPFISTAFITKSIEFLIVNHEKINIKGLVPSLELTDSVKFIENNYILSSPNRERLKTVQTPQIFYKNALIKAHKKVVEENCEITDDASALELIGEKVLCIQGEITNKKITHIEDLKLLEQEKIKDTITAFGYDVHAYCEENSSKARPFKLGTILIPTKIHIKAHSDGDVLLHALMDALLSLIAAGDIGKHFPDNDKSFENISSAILLDKVMNLLLKYEKIITLTHVDITLIAQEPKISPYTSQIQKTLANLLSLEMHQVNIKATTEEKLGFTGEVKGIKAIALVSATRENR